MKTAPFTYFKCRKKTRKQSFPIKNKKQKKPQRVATDKRLFKKRRARARRAGLIIQSELYSLLRQQGFMLIAANLRHFKIPKLRSPNIFQNFQYQSPLKLLFVELYAGSDVSKLHENAFSLWNYDTQPVDRIIPFGLICFQKSSAQFDSIAFSTPDESDKFETDEANSCTGSDTSVVAVLGYSYKYGYSKSEAAYVDSDDDVLMIDVVENEFL